MNENTHTRDWAILLKNGKEFDVHIEYEVTEVGDLVLLADVRYELPQDLTHDEVVEAHKQIDTELHKERA